MIKLIINYYLATVYMATEDDKLGVIYISVLKILHSTVIIFIKQTHHATHKLNTLENISK